MGKRGPQPQGKIAIVWSESFAYAIGLLVTDGCLSSDGRHVTFVSKDKEQIDNFTRSLKIQGLKIGQTFSGQTKKASYRVQFGDKLFYAFLQSIGLSPAKSKTIGEVVIAPRYFFDFLRGTFDGDGCFYSYWDPRWRSSHMFYIEFISASKKHLDWIQAELFERLGVTGHITRDKKGSTYQMKYAKREALAIIRKMYYTRRVVCLSRKWTKIEKALAIEEKQQKLYS